MLDKDVLVRCMNMYEELWKLMLSLDQKEQAEVIHTDMRVLKNFFNEAEDAIERLSLIRRGLGLDV